MTTTKPDAPANSDAEAERAGSAEDRRAEAPLVDELRAAGEQVDSVWELVTTSGASPKAVPILLAHLARPYPAAIREGIARALAVPETKAAGWAVITELYLTEAEPRVRNGLAAAIAAAADDQVIGEVVALARDPRHGPSRVLLLRALEHSADARARDALADLDADPELTREVQAIQRRLKRANRQPGER